MDKITVEALKRLLLVTGGLYRANKVIIDVRTLEEHYKFRLRSSVFLPLTFIQQSIIPIPKHMGILVISNRGERAKQCCLKLDRLGYRSFYLEGGLEALSGDNSSPNICHTTSNPVSNTKGIEILLGRGNAVSHLFAKIVGAAWFFKQIKVNTKFIFYQETFKPRKYRNLIKFILYKNRTFEDFIYIGDKKTPSREICYAKIHGHRMQDRIFEACLTCISVNEQHEIISKIPINPDVQKQADEYIRSNLKGDWVGVHLRGTDLPISFGIDNYLDRCIAGLKASIDKHCSIFLCSDQAQFIDRMYAEFPARVFARDIPRSYAQNKLHQYHTYRYSGFRALSQQKDAVIDILILSRARTVYRSIGRYGLCTRFFNPSIEIKSIIN